MLSKWVDQSLLLTDDRFENGAKKILRRQTYTYEYRKCLKFILLNNGRDRWKLCQRKHCQRNGEYHNHFLRQLKKLTSEEEKTMSLGGKESLSFSQESFVFFTQESLESFSAFCTTSSIPPTM